MTHLNFKWILSWSLMTTVAGIFALFSPRFFGFDIEVLQDRLLNQIACGLVLGILQSVVISFISRKAYLWFIFTMLAYLLNVFTFGVTGNPEVNLLINNVVISAFQCFYLFRIIGKNSFYWIVVFSFLVFIAPFLIVGLGKLSDSFLAASVITFILISLPMGTFLSYVIGKSQR